VEKNKNGLVFELKNEKLVSFSGNVKIIDFNIAKALSRKKKNAALDKKLQAILDAVSEL